MKLSLLAVALTAIALTGCGKPKQALPENSTTYGTVDENGQKLDQAPLDTGSTPAAPSEGAATGAASSVVDTAKTGAEATADAAKDAASATVDAAKNAAGTAVDAAKATAADVKDAAGKSVDVMKGATEGAKKGALDAMGK